MSRGIYLDHHATTPCDPQVVEAMLPCFQEDFGNPSSTQHEWGRRAAARVDRARGQVAAVVGGEPSEIVFTSGATEADNLALFGVVEAARQRTPGAPLHVVTQCTEHKAVLDACTRLESEGVSITYLPVEADGRVDPSVVEQALRDETVLVSIMVANNEIGALQPLFEISPLCHERGIPLHADGAQALAWDLCKVAELGVDLLSLSSHKAYGPPGVGALWVRRRRPRVRLVPRQWGGGHERGRRSGTLDVPAIVGFGVACQLVAERGAEDARRVAGLRDFLLDGLATRFPGLRVQGGMEHRLPNNLNVSLPGVAGEALLDELEGLAISTGAACTSNGADASHVLMALPGGRDIVDSVLRFGLGRTTTAAEIREATDEIGRAVGALAGRPRPATPLGVCGIDAADGHCGVMR